MSDQQGTDTSTTVETGTEKTADAPSKFDAAMDAFKQQSEGSTELPTPQEKGDTQDDTHPKETWEERYKAVQVEKDRQVSDYQNKLQDLAVSHVQKDPQYLHELAKKDTKLADSVVKTLLGDQGFTSYAQLQDHLEKQNLPEDTRNVLVDKIEPIQKELEEVKTKLSQKEAQENALFYAQFKEEHPEFKGDVEKKTLEFFDKTQLPLDECLSFVKHKMGIEEDINQREERVYRNLESKKVATALSSSTASIANKKAPQASSKDLEFLQGIGASKTLQKYT